MSTQTIAGHEVSAELANLVADWHIAIQRFEHAKIHRNQPLQPLASEVERLGHMIQTRGPWTLDELEAGVLEDYTP